MDIVSYIPGRLRIRLDDLYLNRDLASNLYTKLYSISNVHFVEINIYTRKILILYESKNICEKDLLSNIRSCFESKYEKSNLNLNVVKNTDYDIISTPSLEYSLFMLLAVYLTLITGQYSITPFFLLLISLYKAILCVLNSLLKEKLYKLLKNKKNKRIFFQNIYNANSTKGFYNKIVILIMLFAPFFPLNSINFTLLLSTILLLFFNSLHKSKSMALDLASIKLLNTDILLIDFDKINKIAAIDSVVIDKTMDKTDIDTSFIESLRESGILDIHVLTNNYNIENQGKSLELKVFKLSTNQEENARYIKGLKKENKVVAFISKHSLNERFLDEIDIKICISDNLKSIDPWDLVIPSYNFNALGEALDYCKFTIENIHQNKLICLWINIIGMFLALSQRLNLIYSWLLLIASKILIYINSLRLLNYEPTYI